MNQEARIMNKKVVNWSDFLRGVVLGIMVGIWGIYPLLTGQDINTGLGFIGGVILVVVLTYFRERKLMKDNS